MGLEFDHVFVIGMEEGIFPHGRSTKGASENGIEEERRLCYVAMTRARSTLTLVYAVQRHLYGTTQFNFASRFLEEIPNEHVEEVRRRSDRPDQHSHPRRPEPVVRAAVDSPTPVEPDGRYRVGMRVVHPMFGVGTVRVCDRSGNDEKLVVHFQRAGVKKLVARFARLEIV